MNSIPPSEAGSLWANLKQLSLVLGKLLLLWFAIFLLGRLGLLLYQREDVLTAPWSAIIRACYFGWKVDLAMAAYLMLPSVVLLAGFALSGKALWHRLHRMWLGFSALLMVLLEVAEIPLYREWNHKLTFKAIWFLRNPSEVFHTASWGQLLALVLVIGVGGWVLRRLLRSWNWPEKAHRTAGTLFLLLFIPLLLLAARGGWRPIPLQISDAYFSTNPTLNAVSANTGFHLLSNVLQHLEAVKPYAFMPSEEARALTQSLYAPSPQKGSMFLTTTRPNVMLVVFEGWSADVVEGLGGMEGMAPRLSGLIREGLSFDSCYASGNLSDQGMGAVFSAYPAQPRTSIVTIPSKYPSLPALPATFRKAGYASSFVFGGQLMYGNIRSYMYHCGFDRIEEEADFPESVYRGRLGVHDGDLFRRQLQVMDALKPPFFSAVFTQSTHGPYDIPGKRQNPFEGQHADYLQSLQYADSALGAFMDAARSRPWFSNTLFVFVSDHHHDTPRGYSYHSPQYRRIPLVFYGPVLKPEFRGRQEHRICSQLDLAATLLAQCSMDASEYQWSRNLMQPGTPESACYTFDEGVGIKVPNAQVVWWENEQRMGFDIAARKSQRDSLLQVAKAFLQRLTEDFDAR